MKPPADLLQPFDFKGVTLAPSRLKSQVDEVKAYYLRMPNDDLLLGFRRRVGRPAPGKELGGWYSSDTFHAFGQFLSGLSRLYAATGDEKCREKVATLIHEWGLCIEADGFFHYTRKPNSPHYVYDKMVGGLLDARLYCANAEALPLLGRITNWAEKSLDRGHPPISEYEVSEWYTLSENLYRAYRATSETRYRDFAKRWEYTAYWEHLRKRDGIFTVQPCADLYHAYSHVNTLSGAAAAYRASGDRKYLDTIVHAWDYLRATQELATGGYGPDERLLPLDGLQNRLVTSHNTFETQCGSWAVFKLSKYLTSFTGEAKYGDWAERLLYNGVGASIPMGIDGSVFYYSDYNPAGGEKRCIIPWACCTGTLPQAVADYADLIWFHGPDALYVSLFVPSTVRWKVGGADVSVTQATGFPEEEKTTITVSASKPVSFTLAVRRPEWLTGEADVRVNGNALRPSLAKGWMKLKRTWKNGDTVTLALPMRLSKIPYPGRPVSGFPAAVNKGPVTLAFVASSGNPARKVDWNDVGRALKPDGAPLRYRLAGHEDVTVVPFYTLQEGEPYFIYLDPHEPRASVSHARLAYTGEWSDFGGLHASRSSSSTVLWRFTGRRVIWRGFRYDDAGRAEVRIDGKPVMTVDQYNPRRDVPFAWESPEMASGPHSIEIRVLADHNPASKDGYVNVASLESVE